MKEDDDDKHTRVHESDAGMKEDDDDKHTRFRWWLHAARYAVATVVTMLTAAVIAGAIVEFLRSEKLSLEVVNGYVTVDKIKVMSPRPLRVGLSFALKMYNPSGRATICYRDVNVTFRYPDDSVITSYNLSLLVPPQTKQTSYQRVNFSAPSEVPLEFAQKMHDGVEINNTKMVLSGTFETQISLLKYKRDSRTTKYHCLQLTIGTSQQSNANDVSCTEDFSYGRAAAVETPT